MSSDTRAKAIEFDAAAGADYLGLRVIQLQRLARAGRIAHTRVGRAYGFSQEDLDEFLARGRRDVVEVARPNISSISARTAARHRQRRSA